MQKSQHVAGRPGTGTGPRARLLALSLLIAAIGSATALAQDQTQAPSAPAATAAPVATAVSPPAGPPAVAPAPSAPSAMTEAAPSVPVQGGRLAAPATVEPAGPPPYGPPAGPSLGHPPGPPLGLPLGPPMGPPMGPLDGTAAAPVGVLPPPVHDLSPMGMFLAADPIVKGVMILLAVASVATWTVLLVRGLGLFVAKIRLRRSLRIIREAGSLAEASAKLSKGVGASLLNEAAEEARLSEGLPSDGVKERVHIALSRLETAIGRRMAIGTGILATVGSVGPFVGLFGTVWGIMRSFIGIANSNTTNLAVVAPGIAEALLATGIGLVAAIPAVIIYNSLLRSIASYRAMMGDAVALILRHLSRELDRNEQRSVGHERGTLRQAAE